MNKLGVMLASIFFVFGILALTANADNHPKPESKIEFGISKHAGLHYVNGGFSKFKIMKGEKVVAGYKNLFVTVDISSLWTWQSDASQSDDPKRTADLLSKDWFWAKKYPAAIAHFKLLPLNNGKVNFDLRIRGIQKVIQGEVKDGYLKFRIVLKDFNLASSWKRIFAGKFADVKVKLTRKI